MAMFEAHAPADFTRELPQERVAKIITSGNAIEMIVLCADIRSSTLLMREAVDFKLFASIIGRFVTSVRDVIRDRRGWFDKFTGDGFLAYWIVDNRHYDEYFAEVLATASAILKVFRVGAEPALKQNSRNVPARMGISVGLDGGPGYLVEIANDMTIVGPPVVGAVRMVAAAEPNEVIANMYIGARLLEKQDNQNLNVTPVVRASKEYPGGQQVFLLGLGQDE